ncbi:O-methyltransferase [Paenibacillus yanchengensis]|uniref:O-methyltransferase n=1 Tax=Paenibacillus yanchengensis TaxID=2035833 RepID=A0ABW4YQ11_9BACL
MNEETVSLSRQVDFVFRQLEKELTNAVAGTVLIHIRNNAIGKFGVKHHPINCKDGKLENNYFTGLTPSQVEEFRQIAVQALQYRSNWTHGEILYDFSVKQNPKSWSASVLYESNYNMAYWNSNYSQSASGASVMERSYPRRVK